MIGSLGLGGFGLAALRSREPDIWGTVSGSMQRTDANRTAYENALTNEYARAGVAHLSETWYWEITPSVDSGGLTFNCFMGMQRSGEAIDANISGQVMLLRSTGTAYVGSGGATGTTVGTGVAYSAGDVISYFYVPAEQKLYVGKNGIWMNSGDPAAGTGALFTGFIVGQGWMPYVFCDNNSTSHRFQANFGQSAFAYPAMVPASANAGWFV